jgi:PHAX RNA-binding domain
MKAAGASAQALQAVCDEIAAALQEPNHELMMRVVKVIGPGRARALCDEALRVEAHGGLLVEDQSRRRTPGGVFFHLARGQVSRREFYRIFRPGLPTTNGLHTRAHPCTWEDVRQAIGELANTAEEATVKLTLIGRPTSHQVRGQAIVFQLTGKRPGNLPKELPPLPKGPPLTWTVLVGMRQWNRVKETLAQHPDDTLVLEGYPCQMGEQHVLLATNCQSVKMQAARKAAQQQGAREAT